jgi:Fe-S cluster assembly iron-binding protein IscA
LISQSFSDVNRKKKGVTDMFSATFSAKKKLKDILEREKQNEETLIRIAPSSEDQQQLGFFLDTEKEGDQVVLDHEGLKLLLIGQNVSPVLGERTLDYREMGEGMRFTRA